MDKVKVIFRKNKDGDVIAFLPELRVNHGNIASYMHIGQHNDEVGNEIKLYAVVDEDCLKEE